jgi:hypothetical protein
MGVPRRIASVVLCVLGVCPALPGQHSAVRGQGSRETLAWAPVPRQPSAWVAPNKAHWRLTELLDKHKGKQNWTESEETQGR